MAESYQSVDLLSKVAGLQLVPENQSRLVTLTTLAFTCACVDTDEEPRISTAGLRRLIGSMPGQELNDPHFGPVCQSFYFYGGDHLVLPGLLEHGLFITRALADGLFLRQRKFANTEFARAAYERLKAVLALSTTICRSAGLGRNLPMPDDATHRRTELPDSITLKRLADSVRFSADALVVLLREHDLSHDALADFTADCGTWMIHDYISADDNPLFRKPLVAHNDQVVVASPTDLLSAWCRWVRINATEQGLSDLVAEHFADSVLRQANTCTDLLGWEQIATDGSLHTSSASGCTREAVYATDSDKAVHLLSMTDCIAATPDADTWTADALRSYAESRIIEVSTSLHSDNPRLNEIIHVVLVQPAGRPSSFELDNELPIAGEIFLCLAAELSIFAHLECNNPLALRQFLQITNAARNTSYLHALSFLDLYWLYRSNDSSYYITDDSPPDMLGVQPDQGMTLATEVMLRRDFHGSLSPNGAAVEVAKRHETGDIPIYFAPSYSPKRASLLVEGYPIPIWICAGQPLPDNPEPAPIFDLLILATESIAYWLWQFTPMLSPILAPLESTYDSFIINISASPGLSWDNSHDSPDDPSPAFTVSQEHGNILQIYLGNSFPHHIATTDNTGERELVRALLKAITQCPGIDIDNNADEIISEWLDDIAPTGAKRIFQIADSNYTHPIAHSSRQPQRMIQAADEGRILDSIGKHLHIHLGYPVGTGDSKHESHDLLNTSVEYLLAELEKLVATLSPTHLLERLVDTHDRLVFARDFHNSTLASRVACYQDASPEMAREFADETAERSQASVTLRFLIEYCSARPPQGLRPISTSVIDDMMAIGSTIVNFGFQSDLIYNNIAGASAQIAPSGRLAIRRKEYIEKRDRHLHRWAKGEMSRRSVDHHALESDEFRRRKEDIDAQYKAAFPAEFGFTLDDLHDFINSALALPIAATPVGKLSQDDLIKHIATDTGMDIPRAETILDALLLRPRDEYLAPPQPYHLTDTFPWRFTRRLSFARKPFILREQNGTSEIIWGQAHLASALGYFHSILLTDRIKASSDAMQTVVGKATKLAGDRFEAEVVSVARSLNGTIVRGSVRKIGNIRLTDENGLVLGDIDALVAIPSKKHLWIVECKDFNMSRTPSEFSNEIRKTLESSPSKRSLLEKHERRVQWARENIGDILEHLALGKPRRWRIGSLFVTRLEQFGMMLGDVPIRVMSIEELRESGFPNSCF